MNPDKNKEACTNMQTAKRTTEIMKATTWLSVWWV
jgi:hypothetical protein